MELPVSVRQAALATSEFRRSARDPVLIVIAVLGIVTCGWYALDLGSSRLQLALLWPVQVALDLGLAVLAWRVASRPRILPPQRRLWSMISLTGALTSIGDTVQSVVTIRSPVYANADGGVAQTSILTACLIGLVLIMLFYPNPTGTSGERLRLWLDSATVLIAGAVLAWWFAANAAKTGTDLATAVVNATMLLVAGFGIIRLTFSSITPMTLAASVPMALGTVLLGIPSALGQALPEAGITPRGLAIRLVPSFLFLIGCRVEELQYQPGPAARPRRERRPYRLLPYVAVVVTLTVLVVVAWQRLSGELLGLILGAVMVMCVIMIRQLLMVGDNTRLIKQMDTILNELRSREHQLRDQASHDGLTGLLNRTAFTDGVNTALLDNSPDRSLHLLLIDLDGFKAVNDTFGHDVGDTLLVTVARRLGAVVRHGDIVARLGGDEFAVLASGGSGPASPGEDHGERLAARVLADLARPVHANGRTLTTQATVGIARAEHGDRFDELSRKADIAMYAAKDAGKNGFRRYTPDMRARILETAQLGASLGEAIGSDQLTLHYQPIVTLPERKTVGMEALLRWDRPGLGPIAPQEFIPVAEQTGLIVPLGRWILREACQQAASWRQAYPEAADLVMNVNVAGRQLQERSFAAEVAAILDETGLPPGQLTIEVTETAVLQGPQIDQTLAALRTIGVGMALDDFGTAASSLGLLLTCPVGTLKLDRSFVDGATSAARQATVATAVIQIAQALDMSAIAEGIESEDQAAFLHSLGYPLGQGFLFSRPRPAGELEHGWRSAAPLAAP